MRLVTILIAASLAAPMASAQVKFTDITATAGIKFTHNSGRAGKKYLPETLGSGGAFVDFDGDGWQDVVLINSKDWSPRGRRSLPALYKNNRNGTFTNVTASSGAFNTEMYGLGVAAGDYDNDGRPDLYVTALEGDHLFHNEGNGKFTDVTKAMGIANANFATSVAWLDYDKDGKLDLFVANYVQWNAKGDLWCSLDGATKSYCTPESYKGTSSKLYHNLGNRFADESVKAGVGEPTSKSLGVTIFDYNSDGWPDIFVANDTQPNKLYKNNKNGTFTDEAMAAGVAFGEDGIARGAMGADAMDYDNSGRPHLLVGNFSNQMLGLYHNEGKSLFVDEAPTSAVGRSSLLFLSFGVFFFDYDLDGNQDIFAATGHIEEEIGRVQPKIQYKQAPLLFRNLGKKKFESVGASMGAEFNRAVVARGAAYADIDHDGDLDLLMTTNHGPAYLFRNDGGNKNNWLCVRTVGSKSNRDGIGAVVRIATAAGPKWSWVKSGSSYCSQSDLAVTFGLGSEKSVSSLEIEWPSGTKQKLGSVPANQMITVDESKGIIARSGPGGK